MLWGNLVLSLTEEFPWGSIQWQGYWGTAGDVLEKRQLYKTVSGYFLQHFGFVCGVCLKKKKKMSINRTDISKADFWILFLTFWLAEAAGVIDRKIGTLCYYGMLVRDCRGFQAIYSRFSYHHIHGQIFSSLHLQVRFHTGWCGSSDGKNPEPRKSECLAWRRSLTAWSGNKTGHHTGEIACPCFLSTHKGAN